MSYLSPQARRVVLAQSWIWAIACAIFVYAGFRVAAMFWVSRKIHIDAPWSDLRDSALDDDDDTAGHTVRWDLADHSHWDRDPGQEVYGQPDRDWAEELSRPLGSHDPSRRAIEADHDD